MNSSSNECILEQTENSSKEDENQLPFDSPEYDENQCGSTDGKECYEVKESHRSFLQEIHPFNICKNETKVEERLIRAGKKYEEKRRKLQQDIIIKKSEEEEKLVSISQRASVRSCDPSQPRVEERLRAYNDNLGLKLQLKKQEIDSQSQKVLKKPVISEMSKIIVTRMKRIPKVEDRLLFDGRKSKLEMEAKIKEAEDRVRLQSAPLSRDSSQILKTQRKDLEVVERLYQPKCVPEPKNQINYSFHPYVDHELNEELISQRNQTRSKSRIDSSKDEHCTFKPKISKKTAELAANQGTSEDRLLKLKAKNVVSVPLPSFKPCINPVSDDMDKKLNKKGVGRWEALYGLNEKHNINLEIQRKKEEEKKKKEQEQYSFHPQIVSQEPAYIQGRRVEDRTKEWNERKNNRLKSLKEREQEKELNGCTFKPKLNEHAFSRKIDDNGISKNYPKLTERNYGAIEKTKKVIQQHCEQQFNKIISGKKDAKIKKGKHISSKSIVDLHGKCFSNKKSCAGVVLLYTKIIFQGDKTLQDFEELSDEKVYLGAMQDLHKDLMSIKIENPNFNN